MKAVFCFASAPKSIILQIEPRLNLLGIKLDAIVSHYNDLKIAKEVYPDIAQYCISNYNHPWSWNSKIEYSTYDNIRTPEQNWTYPFDKDLFDNIIRPRLSSFLPLTERYEPFEGGVMESETRLIFDFSLAHYILIKHKPDFLLSTIEPHNPLEVMLYEIAEHIGIKILVVRTAFFRHQNAVSSSIYAPLVDSNWEKSAETFKVDNFIPSGERTHPRTTQIINKILKPIGVFEPDYMIGLEIFKSKKQMLKELWKDKVLRNRLLYFGQSVPFGSILKFKLFQNYKNSSSSLVLSKNGPIVFFPLHYQPELTTMPRGFEYVNQIKAIKMLSDALPEDGQIIVKEHPGIFSKAHNVNKNFRSLTYYNWIARIPKVTLVPIDTSSDYLQEISNYVATITGNAGFEAMLRGKRVLVFGAASYLNGPNVFKVNSIQEIKHVLDSPFYDVNIEEHNENVLRYVSSVSQFCYHTDLDFNSPNIMESRLLHSLNSLFSALEKSLLKK